MGAIEQANTITDLLLRAPLAGFLALTLIALVAVFVLLLREKASHLSTVREVVALTTAISSQWDRQLDLQERIARDLERLGLSSEP
jgi:hypothetical protein